MHQMQIPFTQKNEPNSAVRQQKIQEPRKIQGDSFRTVLAKERKIKKELDHADDKRNISVKKKEQHKKSGTVKKVHVVPKNEINKKKKNILSDRKIIKTDLKKPEKEKLKRGEKEKNKPVEKKKKENIHKIEKEQVHNHASNMNPVSVLLSAGSLKDGKTTAVKELNKGTKDKKEHGVKKVSLSASKETSHGLKVIDLRSKKRITEKDTLKKIKGNHHKNRDADVPVKNIKHDQDQGSLVKLVTTHQTDKAQTPDAPRYSAPAEAKAVLLKELQDKMNDRIVKESGIILKDNNSGEIKLILKPESLGKVRIRLHLQDNQLTGKIFVNNPQAQDVFEKNMQTLARAFSDSGFTMSSMDVSVGGKGKDPEQKEERKISNRILGTIENSIPVMGKYKYSDNLIDLVV